LSQSRKIRRRSIGADDLAEEICDLLILAAEAGATRDMLAMALVAQVYGLTTWHFGGTMSEARDAIERAMLITEKMVKNECLAPPPRKKEPAN